MTPYAGPEEQLRRDFVQAHVEKLLEEITGFDEVYQDDDGD